jgi:uncharacterized peroxidase-related enzyme
VEEDEAIGEVAELYETIKRDMQMPFVPNMVKALAVSPAALKIQWGMVQAFYSHTTLPQSLIAMISFTIAEKSHCTYCSAANELTCRTLGVDEETLALLIKDLDSVNPERIRAIIEFALKVAKDPQGLVAADYDRVREQGVMDEEIVEIIVVASIAVLSDIMADALKVEVEAPIAEALGR